jgi:hypothetical protein
MFRLAEEFLRCVIFFISKALALVSWKTIASSNSTIQQSFNKTDFAVVISFVSLSLFLLNGKINVKTEHDEDLSLVHLQQITPQQAQMKKCRKNMYTEIFHGNLVNGSFFFNLI